MDLDQEITKIPYPTLLKLSQHLDVGNNDMNWRALIANIPDQIYDDTQIETFALAVHEYYGSPAMSLLRNLGDRMRTVRQLISYLEKMSHEKCLCLLKLPERIRLLQVPLSQTVQAGPQSQAVLACNAKGFPFPHYCWYRAYAETNGDRKDVKLEEVQNETDRVLRISPVWEKHSGAYCCKVYHTINGAMKEVFTDWAYLEVCPASEEDSYFLDEDAEQMLKPQIVQQPPVSLSVRPGKPIKVTCLATGCPTPKYQWYRYGYSCRDSPLEPHALRDQTDKTLYWAQSTTGDQGKYCCRVWNKAGCATSITVSINVDARLAESYPDKIEVVRHPQSISCRIGEPQILACHAVVSQGTLYYQWYLNHQEIPKATQPELHFLQVKPEDHGVYQCRVYNEYACVFSNEAMLDVIGGMIAPTSNCQFYATDKVALLIGNLDYRSAGQLKAPEVDVEELTKVLSELEFKVVSLLDLNLQEMIFAIKAFCDLLNSGVYGLFYFSGHGFETDGQSYLVPVDARTGYSTTECMCDQQVLDLMQYRNTALNVLLLDICRKANDDKDEAPAKFQPKVKGNTVFGYAAQTNTQAWEVDGQPSGIFTKYLIKRIRQAKKITHVLEDVMEDVHHDHCGYGRQYPSLSHDLNEARSLRDPINPSGHTQEINARSKMWAEAHLLPKNPIWMKFGHDVMVGIDLATRFSNVMLMHTYIPPNCMGEATNCHVKLENFSPELDINMQQHDVGFGEYPSQTIVKMIVTTVRNLQRLRGDLECTVTVEGMYRGKPFKETLPLFIHKPLVSKLWQTKHYAIPSEDSCPDSSTSTE
ncbi:mucosa-associated lymphoid tissue lymphoma translocation protein 1-like [Patiria miniata]|uniref:Mucosa-associated lymphoid tissue lymphoma translocation protein 1 n=1 Tax=Patiria miniata TaxID=46514 RepID=A0A914BJY2_PATMI|nr:mucosa-associated lymphoid tissue lymphoma translocation protein 1-like [Patiria miniata]XP_038076600.1 mucosa-associated lymphoid tissue lymphoma translocation protein 1-like [Patiria miniata]XP_038076601.1 mucosa-associated lymphoid tissue lymphoma translocation protein 1-like [Patiria miniata]XP_038076602.1 mucosa-associated lymphoid tissue lymphoma translocation protein 1-like [Patiria miniata]